MALADRPKPKPALGEVLIRVAFTGICGSDIHGYTGHNGRRSVGQVMGHETSGTIEAFGPDGAPFGLEVGDAVTFNPVVLPLEDRLEFTDREQHSPRKSVIGVDPARYASFADYVVVPAVNVLRLADGMPVEHGALVEPTAVALHAVRRAGVTGRERVLVIGGGPIGQSVVLVLQALGVAEIYVSEISAGRRRLIEELGVAAIDPSAGDPVDALGRRGGPVDVVIDAVGSTRSLADALEGSVLGGTVCLVGMGEPQVRLDAFQISTGERTLVGSFTYSARDFADAAALVAGNPLTADALISRVIGPESADEAFTNLANGDEIPGKVLVSFAPVPEYAK
ncbi:alcohol dehydrogenase catalytic domain-containing protein [Herbiconiux sp. KACC 21604]|uniref:zinc-dependent alcohol dehydrogenase n=1 Tax=unclassified Herbiconiux TaxID=2618217 RepID=UPI0014922D2A|nr:alcohol dehydrogenase catalytic domain-containing protein [Herbiconiux sp. SALV-R1]QJU55108.1 alcohol dehydrogenase catalytic domain-containing protein [Herbiconiux sp. SALV-R1]WPO86256.1 alcohol dehydrogenase catalytic domain-containing protein [Herbiconiux sp. KACC 21604]